MKPLTRRAALGALAGGVAGLTWLYARLRPRPNLDPLPEPGRHRVRVIDSRRIVPGPGLPPQLALGASNNNLDALRHRDGYVYLAFRTAPHHFANRETAIYVLRSRDEQNWEFEARFHLGHDLREPRLLAIGERLFLYISRLGSNPLAFEPQGMVLSQRGDDGGWSPLEPFADPGLIGWRTRYLGDVPVMLAYSGGESIYRWGEPRLEVRLLRSDDGRRWTPYDPAHPVVYRGGGSEADAVLGDDGTLYAVIRNEAGDDGGWGSKVCRARPGSPAVWECTDDVRKFDSPFAFSHDGEAYVIARRQLSGDGRYDLGAGPGRSLRTLRNQVAYSISRKRTALWRFVPGANRLAFVLDLPSRGDCCFPAVLDGDSPQRKVVYDYSCDIDGPDLAWIRGQRGETFLYRHVLEFTA